MLMPAQFIAARLEYVPNATSSKADYPVTNLNIIGSHPLAYSWRSNNLTTNHTIDLDLGAIKTVAAVALLKLNMLTVTLTYSTNGTVFTQFTESPFTMTKDPFGPYYKKMIAQVVSARYLRIFMPTQTPITGENFFEIGMVWVTAGLDTFPYQFVEGMRQTPKRDYIQTGQDVSPVGMWYSEEDWNSITPNAEIDKYSKFALYGQELPVLVFKNLGDLAEVGIYRLRDAVSFTRDSTTMRISTTLRELV